MVGFKPQYWAYPRKPRTPSESQQLYNHIRTLAFYLDALSSSTSFIPPNISQNLPFDFGIDAIVGAIIPIGGDLIGLVLGLYIVGLCCFFGISAKVVGMMLFNVLIDALIGIVPVIGDILDIAFKSNLRNLSLLENHLSHSPRHFHIIFGPSGKFTNSAPNPNPFNKAKAKMGGGGGSGGLGGGAGGDELNAVVKWVLELLGSTLTTGSTGKI